MAGILPDRKGTGSLRETGFAGAGTGSGNEELEWGRRHIPAEPSTDLRRRCEIIGIVVLYKRPAGGDGIPDAGDCKESDGSGTLPEFSGDLVFSMFERQERISGRLNNKIRRLEERLRAVEERGRG